MRYEIKALNDGPLSIPNYYQHEKTIKYATYGVAGGVLFLILAFIVSLSRIELSFSLTNIVYIYQDDPLLWIISTIPLIIGSIAAIAGSRQDALLKANNQLEKKIQNRTSILQKQNEDLSKEIEHRNKIESKLKQAREDAENATRVKTRFLSTMSHEIRTPLNAVVGMSSLLLSTSLTEEQQGYSNTIKKGGEDLLRIVDDILDWTKMEAGRIVLENKPFETIKAMEEVVDGLISRATLKGLELIYDLDSTAPNMISSDIHRIKQILFNIVGNAIKFTHNGEVHITCRLSGENQHQWQLEFCVRDTGIGIEKNQLVNLFHSFSQVDSSINRKYEGSGLGLAICQKIITLLGGEIWVESELGKGSSFYFTINVNKTNEDNTLLSRRNYFSGYTILLIDDNATNLASISTLLKEWGFTVHEFGTPKNALTMLKSSEEVDLMIVDMYMPEMDGIEFAEKAKLIPPRSHTPLILVNSEYVKELKFHPELFATFIPKPIKRSILFGKLNRILLHKDIESIYPQSSNNIPHGNLQIDESLRILIAEDNPVNQKVASQILNKLGIQPDVVNNGKEAVEAMEMLSYDIILMDVHMPIMNGIEATKMIRAMDEEEIKQPVIFALTADVMQENQQNCIDAGMNDFISKPIKLEELGRIISNWV